MKEQLAQRLEALRAELKTGHEMQAHLESRLGQLRATLLRISGAIQVLEELLGQETPQPETPQNAELSIHKSGEAASEH
jgi:hypothetical protein